jgi:hypothetical protein
MRRLFSLVTTFAVLATLATADEVAAATVNYQGMLYDFNGTPVQGGRVIAGTFKPGFNISNYSCTYGDAFCNTDSDNYAQAVADGNFIPLNSGVLTNSSGFFSGSGTSNAVGSQIWIYGFSGSQPVTNDLQQLLASSSNASYVVPGSGSITAFAATANQFVYGAHFSNGFQLGGVPFPEPTSSGLALLSLTTLVMRRVRPRSVSRA